MALSLESIKRNPLAAGTNEFHLSRLLLASFLITALSACGGGGGGGGDNDTGASAEPEATDTTVVVATEPEFQIVRSGESVTGSLTTGEFVTYRVPADSQVLLRSDTGDSDLLLQQTPNFDEPICISSLAFREAICSGNGSGEFLYATVSSTETGNYTLSVTNDCSVANINQWVYRSMQDYYLFADQVPIVNPADYDSPAALFADLRFSELDPFSGIFETDVNGRTLGEGNAFGFGAEIASDNAGNLRIINVHAESPFGLNGVKRGDILHSLGGILTNEITEDQILMLIGPDDDPRPAEWTFEDGETGELESFIVAKTEYPANTVSFTSYFTEPSFDGKIGYIVLSLFHTISIEELDRAISELRDENVTELVLDLRYNPGGFVIVAERLAAQLSGNRLTGQVLQQKQHNDTYRHLDAESRFADVQPTLNLSKVIVLTTPNTGSVSETVINSLRPYMEVVTVGQRTAGKPFLSNRQQFCGITLNAMHSQNVNALDVSVSGGIEADCFAADDRTRDYGLGPAGIEGMLASALEYAVFGTCNAAPTAALASRDSLKIRTEEWGKTGEIKMLNAIQDKKSHTFDLQ